jgi:mannose-1-phosphate guanylyltransferase
MNQHHFGLILAGGRGTRFWPKSRKVSAKQILNVVGRRSLIQDTVSRLAPVIPPERIWVLTNRHLRPAIIAQLPRVPAAQILAEPAQRNTAPAIGLAAHILDSIDPDAVMGVFPADHVIAQPAVYRKTIRAAFRGASEGRLVVVGIPPRWPETGYGYVEFPKGAAAGSDAPLVVRRFREKPTEAVARRYVKAGRFYWNSGMFFWRADTLLEELKRHLPKTASLLASLPPFRNRGFAAALQRTFPLCESISIDYALMEKSKNVSGIAAADFGWNDVGSWNAVYELLSRDASGNCLCRDSVSLDSHNNFVDARGKFVALLGVKDLIVVDTKDALLVAARDRAQQVGDIVKELEKRGRRELL